MRRLFAIFIPLALCALASCTNHLHNNEYRRAEKGVLDLRGWDFNNDGPVPLSGEWEFYWQHLYPPPAFKEDTTPERTAFASVPGVWTKIESIRPALPGKGYATYRLRVILDRPPEGLAIRSITASTAFSLHVNDTEVSRSGSPGTGPDESLPRYKPQVSGVIDGDDNTLDLVLDISNFHYRCGGPWRHFWLGMHDDLVEEKWLLDIRSMFLFGTLLIMAMYHLALYLIRREDRHFLFMALFCLFISLRSLFTGEYIITRLIPDMPFSLMIRIEYLSYYFAIVAANYLFSSLYPQEFHRRQPAAVAMITGIFSLVVIFTPVSFFTRTISLYYLATLIVIVYILAANILAAVRKRQGALIVLFGAFILAVATLNDNLYSSFKINTGNMIDMAVVIFVFCQAVVLSLRFTDAFNSVEKLTFELADLNTGLERQVSDRTMELQQAYESIRQMSLRDPLTGCYNRRHLEEELPKEIERAIRYRRPLSVIMCDIDRFKPVNDTYGHQTGDEVLAFIGLLITETMRDRSDWVCRYGGEEFFILMPETEPKGGAVVAERLRRRIEQTPIMTGTLTLHITVSFGVAGFTVTEGDGDTVMRDLIERADRMLYRAKAEGRNRVAVME